MDIRIRPLQLEDAETFALQANNKAIFDRLTDAFPHPYTVEHAKAFIQRQLDQDAPNVMGIEVDGAISGAIGIHPKSDVDRLNAEMGYWLAEPLWGRGIITEAIKQMVPYTFDHFKINRIFARPYGDNRASQRVLEKAGFILEARFEKTLTKNGEMKDELIYAVRRP